VGKKQERKPEEQATMPPANPEAEQSVLGAILLRPAVLDEVADILSANDFYREAHRKIFRVMMELYLKNEPVDMVTVNNLLKERGQLEEVGGPLFLTGLSEHVGIAANASYYARIVKEKAKLRRLLAASQEIATACLARVESVDEFIDWSEDHIFQIKDDQEVQAASSLEDLLPQEQARIEAIYYRKREILGVPSGFIDLDNLTSGWQDGDLIIIAARPSHGKTALGVNICHHAARRAQVPAGIVSMEQPKEQLVQRLMASVGQINASRLRSAKMSPGEWVKFNEVIEKLAEVPLYIIDKPAMTILEIRSQARRLKSRHGIGLLVVDYLQLARDPKARSREQEIASISRSLKALAKELHLPVIALCQLNRDVEKRPNKRPQLADLRESGAIEQDADLVIFIYRDEVYRQDSPEAGLAEIHLAKQRNGPTGKIKLAYLAEFLLFQNLAREENDY